MVLLQATPSWDLVITLIFVIGVTYGFMIVRDRIMIMLLSLYAGTAIANALTEPLLKFFKGDVPLLNKLWVDSSASPFTIKLALFVITIVILGAKTGLAGRRSNFSMIELAGYSILNVCIGLSSVLSFMDADKLKALESSSKLVAIIMQHQTLWLIAPLIILAVLGGTGGRGGGYYPPDY